MEKQKEELFMMSKSRKPTLAEWTMQNGIILNQKSKPKTTTTVGAIHESPAKTTTVTTKTRDPFLEGFYSVEDKPETEKRTYLQHRESPTQLSSRPKRRDLNESARLARNDTGSAQTNVGAGVSARPHSRTTLRKAPTQKPEAVKLPYRPSVQGPPKMTKLPYIPAQDGPPKMTQYGKQTAPAYDSPVKIVGDNVTEKDYEDFWEAFRKESTADKLGWVNNQLQTQPKAQEKTQRQSIPQNRCSQNMMQWAMRERESLTKPQSPGRKQYITDEKDRAFLEGFNQDREEESRWKHMLDTLARGVSDVADKVDTVGDGISTFKNYTDDMNVLDALSATLNDYGKLDDVTNAFFKAYDYAQENPWKLAYAIDSFLDYPSLHNALNGNINRKILYPMGIIANDIMRDKIAKNNYEQNQKVDFSEHYDNDGYINNQNIKDSKMRELRYGDWDMYNNGCELIAVHNSLNSLGNPKDIRDVAKDFEKKGQTLYGYFGTSPYAVGNYFRESGYDVETYEGDDVISSLNLPKADSYILSFWNNNRFTGAIHTESIQPLSDGRYIVFNSDGGEAKITDNLNEYLAKERRYGKRVPLVLHCISKRAKR